MAGDVADGLIGHPMCPVRWLDEVVSRASRRACSGPADSGRDLDFIPTITLRDRR